jgi:HD-GYP domain-containing protein (c-di-GMP phosphodiesterase class II)
VAIADALDAMTSQRPYRSALTYAEAVDLIVMQAGVQFDPMLVKVLRKSRRKIGRLVKAMGYTAGTATDGDLSPAPTGQLIELPAS